jgi:hypothetical protein
MLAYYNKYLTLDRFNFSVRKRIYTREVGRAVGKGLVEWVKAVIPSGVIAFLCLLSFLHIDQTIQALSFNKRMHPVSNRFFVIRNNPVFV